MKRLFCLLVVLITVVSSVISVTAADKSANSFIKSVTAFDCEIVPVVENKYGDLTEDIIATHYDEEDYILEEVVRRKMAFTDLIKAAEQDIKVDVIDELNEVENVTEILPKKLVKKMKSNDVKVDRLEVAAVFDIEYYNPEQQLDNNETLEFTVRNLAFEAMQNTKNFTGKIYVFQNNTETGEYEALNPYGEKAVYDGGGTYELIGDKIKFRVKHLCEFIITLETAEPQSDGDDTNVPGGETDKGCGKFSILWLLIALLVVLVVLLIIFLVKKKKDKNEENKETDVKNNTENNTDKKTE